VVGSVKAPPRLHLPSSLSLAPKGAPSKKARKARKHKQRRNRETSWPPKPTYTSGVEPFEEQQGNEQAESDALPSASVERNALELVNAGSRGEVAYPMPSKASQANDAIRLDKCEGGKLDDTTNSTEFDSMSRDDRKLCRQEQEFAPATPPSHSQTNVRVHDFDGEQGLLLATPPSQNAAVRVSDDEQQFLPDTLPSHFLTDTALPTISDNEDQVAAGATQVNHRQLPSPDPALGNVSHTNHQGEIGAHHGEISVRRGSHENFDDRLPHTTSHGMGRAHKVRKRPRKGAPPSLLPQKSEYPVLAKLSPESDVLVRMVHMALGASENKARDSITSNEKAHSTAITSLQATIGYQDDVIQRHKAENGRLLGEVQHMKVKFARLEKHANGIGEDYSRIRAKAKEYEESCSRILHTKIAKVEGEKSAFVQQLTTTLDSFDKSRRNMKSVLDDCYTRLVVSEAKKLQLIEQLCRQQSLYEEEKKRRSDLEQHIIPTMKSLQSYIDNCHSTLAEKLERIQVSLDDTTAEEERDARLKHCIDALHNLQANPYLTANEFERVEGILRIMHKR
jgi:hypothetical protein